MGTVYETGPLVIADAIAAPPGDPVITIPDASRYWHVQIGAYASAGGDWTVTPVWRPSAAHPWLIAAPGLELNGTGLDLTGTWRMTGAHPQLGVLVEEALASAGSLTIVVIRTDSDPLGSRGS